MANYQIVTLPSGEEVEFPATMSDAQVTAALQKLAPTTTGAPAVAGFPDGGPMVAPQRDQYGLPMDPSDPTNQQASPTPQQVIGSNMDIPGGIAGSMAGAKAGAMTGNPLIAGAGMVAGGAAGTFGGSILSDWFNNNDADFSTATKEAAISAGLDTATLGAAKAFKPLAKAFGFNPDEMAELFKKYVSGDTTDPKSFAVGSDKSIQQTQNMLREGFKDPVTGEQLKGSLTAYQTGKADTTRRLAEGLGEIGVLSGGGYKKTAQANADILGGSIQDMINDAARVSADGNFGQTFHGVIQAGKESAQHLYNDSMGDIIARVGDANVNPKLIASPINKFIKEHQKSFGSTLDPEALKLAREWGATLDNMEAMPVKDLLEFQKMMNRQISKLGDFGATQNTVASTQLAKLSSAIRERTGKLLNGINPDVYQGYKEANEAYGAAIQGLVPDLNANVIARADKKDYEAIARVLEGKNPDQINAFMKSIDTAFEQVAREGQNIPMDPRTVNKLDIAVDGKTKSVSKDQVRSAIRGGWLKNIFGEQTKQGFDPARFSKLADYYEKPANKRAAQAILGEEWPQFKRLINAMSEATNKQTGFIGSLVLRGKEAQTIQGIGALMTTGAGFGPAAAILGGPVAMRHLVSSPAAVDALLAGNKRAQLAIAAGKASAVSDIMNKTIEQVMGLLPQEAQDEIRNEERE